MQRDQVVSQEGQIERPVRGTGDVEVDHPDHPITVDEQVACVEVAVTDAIDLRRHHRIMLCPHPGLGWSEAVSGVVQGAHGPAGAAQGAFGTHRDAERRVSGGARQIGEDFPPGWSDAERFGGEREATGGEMFQQSMDVGCGRSCAANDRVAGTGGVGETGRR